MNQAARHYRFSKLWDKVSDYEAAVRTPLRFRFAFRLLVALLVALLSPVLLIPAALSEWQLTEPILWAYGSCISVIIVLSEANIDRLYFRWKRARSVARSSETLHTSPKGGAIRVIRDEAESLRRRLGATTVTEWSPPIGKSRVFAVAMRQARAAAQSSTSVLLSGESGTGKDLFARYIHHLSRRADRSFVHIHCYTLSEDLLRRWLSIVEKAQSVTDEPVSVADAIVSEARGGTLYIDEITDLSERSQVMFLRLLEASPFGSCRIIASTSSNLEDEVAEGRFRADLASRLGQRQVALPALRNRKEDLQLLSMHFLRRIVTRYDSDVVSLEPSAISVLEEHSWPGNLRELQNVLERCVVFASGPTITSEELSKSLFPVGPLADTESATLEALEKQWLREMLPLEARLSRERAAELLGIEVETWLLRHWLEKHRSEDE